MKQWYIVKTKPGKEAMAAALLEQGSFEVFYPRLVYGLRARRFFGGAVGVVIDVAQFAVADQAVTD